MALPTNIGFGTVVGAIIDADGTPASGTVKFSPSYTQNKDVTATPKVLIRPKDVIATLDSSGAFSVQLIATDDLDLNPSGFTYSVNFSGLNGSKGGGLPPFSIQVPEGTTVDLAEVIPVGSSGGVVITQGPPGVGVPEGGTGSQVLAKASNADYDTEWVDQTGGGGLTGPVDWDTDIINKPTSFPTTYGDVDQVPPLLGAIGTANDDQAAARDALGAGTVESVSFAGTNVTADTTDPQNPVFTVAGGVADWSQITGKPAVIAAGTDQAAARAAIGAGTSSFSGAYTDLTGKPTIPTVVAASATASGIVELATTVEAAAGVDTQRAVTPAGLGAALNNAPVSEAQQNAIDIAAASSNLVMYGSAWPDSRPENSGLPLQWDDTALALSEGEDTAGPGSALLSAGDYWTTYRFEDLG